MSRWFRFYDDALNDPKVQKLPGELFKFWVNMLCVASKNDGRLPVDELPFLMRISEDELAVKLEELRTYGLVDHNEPHNWKERQFKSDVTDPTNAERQARYRKNHNGKSNAVTHVTVTATRTDTDTEQNTETEKKEAAPSSAPSVDPSIAEKQFFDRTVEVLGTGGRSFGGKLLKSKGGNVALARAALETASQKSNPREWLAAATGPPRSQPQSLKEVKQQRHDDAFQKLRAYANGPENGGEGGGEIVQLLSPNRSQ